MKIWVYNIVFIFVAISILIFQLDFNLHDIKIIEGGNVTNNALILFGLLVGFAFTYKINYVKPKPDKIKKNSLQEIVLFTSNDCYHIHHFIWMTLIIFVVLVERQVSDKRYVNGFLALLIGSSLVDLMYIDWTLVKEDCHENKIMKLFKRKRVETE